MKKIILVLLCMMGFFSCTKDDNGANNKLVGTKWYSSYSNYLMVLEFSSQNNVVGYFATQNGVYNNGRTTGTYKVDGDNVTFSNMTYNWYDNAYYRLDSGNINGSLLSITGQSNLYNTGWNAWYETFTKQ